MRADNRTLALSGEAILIKASVIQRFLQGDDVSRDGTTDVNTLALSGSAVNKLDPTLSDGGLPETFAGVTVDYNGPDYDADHTNPADPTGHD